MEKKKMRPAPQPKSSECFEFAWRRPKRGHGFRWEQVQGRWLLTEPPEEGFVAYEPLVQETGLFLTFANLDGTDAEFLRFANAYGRLGTYHYYKPPGGEPFEEWQRHHRWMQFLTLLRRELLERRPDLKKHLRWEGKEIVFGFPKIGTSARETWRHRGELRESPLNQQGLPLFKPGDLRGPTWWFLVYAINDWFDEFKKYTPVAPKMIWSEEAHRPQFVFGPSSLLGVMVCQFAAALHGGWPFGECAQCHKFFRLAPGINRANRRTCSRTCKQYLYHRRVEDARRLHARGLTDSQIAKELSVRPQGNKASIEIVKSWVKQESGNDRV